MKRALALSIAAHLLLVGVLALFMRAAPAPSEMPAVVDVTLRTVSVRERAPASPPAVAAQSGTQQQPVADAPVTSTSVNTQLSATAEAKEQPPAAVQSVPQASRAAGNDQALAASEALKRGYQLALSRQLLDKPARYPEDARERGIEGTVNVSFTLDARGNITSAFVSGSSGNAALDAAALDAIRKSSPLLAPPEGLAMENLEWDWPVPFQLN